MHIFIAATSPLHWTSIKEMEENFTKPIETTTCDHEALKSTLMELAKTREEIKRTRESAVQSWLDSMPIIKELEKRKADHLMTTKRVSMATTAIASLELLLESTMETTRLKEYEEGSNKRVIEEMQAARDRGTKEMERLKADIEEEKRSREMLKEELKIKRQSLKAVQLTRKAVKIEIKAFNASVDAATHQLKQVKLDDQMVAVSQVEYNELQRKFNEEMALANWRVTASEEQRRAAEASRDDPLRRLEALSSEKQGRDMGMRANTTVEVHEKEDKEGTRKVRMRRDDEIVSPIASLVQQPSLNFGTRKSIDNRKSASTSNREMVKKNPPSCHNLGRFLCGI